MISIGFPAIAHANAKLLILGSLPGRVSLEKREYYAQPQNAFWKIMGELFGAARDVPYEERLILLMQHHVALWDVLYEAQREGSMDADICDPIANDFADFLRTHTRVKAICFNGQKAAQLFGDLVLPSLPVKFLAIPRTTLPSTSPAHAGMKFEAKLARWRKALAA